MYLVATFTVKEYCKGPQDMDHFGLLSTRLLSASFDDRTFGASPAHQPRHAGSYQSHPLSPEQLCRRAAQTPTLRWRIPEATQEL